MTRKRNRCVVEQFELPVQFPAVLKLNGKYVAVLFRLGTPFSQNIVRSGKILHRSERTAIGEFRKL